MIDFETFTRGGKKGHLTNRESVMFTDARREVEDRFLHRPASDSTKDNIRVLIQMRARETFPRRSYEITVDIRGAMVDIQVACTGRNDLPLDEEDFGNPGEAQSLPLSAFRDRPLLESSATEAPETWSALLALAERVGLRVVPVHAGTLYQVEIGDSPGDSVYYPSKGSLPDTLYIDKAACVEETLLHEICHYVVARRSGREDQFNYASDIDDEILACDAQIAYVFVHFGETRAREIASFLQYNTSDESIENTLTAGNGVWQDAEVVLPTPKKGWRGWRGGVMQSWDTYLR